MKIKRFFIVILFLIIGFITGNIVGNYKSSPQVAINSINSALYDLDIEVDLLEHWHQNYKQDSFLEAKLKQSIFTKILLLSKVRPPIDELQGVPVQALYKLLLYRQKYAFTYSRRAENFKTINTYLDEIEAGVFAIVKGKREIYKKAIREGVNGVNGVKP
jgi:hypothetical protein